MSEPEKGLMLSAFGRRRQIVDGRPLPKAVNMRARSEIALLPDGRTEREGGTPD